jgi:hypothetical protein
MRCSGTTQINGRKHTSVNGLLTEFLPVQLHRSDHWLLSRSSMLVTWYGATSRRFRDKLLRGIQHHTRRSNNLLQVPMDKSKNSFSMLTHLTGNFNFPCFKAASQGSVERTSSPESVPKSDGLTEEEFIWQGSEDESLTVDSS